MEEDKKHELFRLNLTDLRNYRLKRPDKTFEKRRKRYHQYPWRTYHDFGFPHYKDEEGREYRKASGIVVERFKNLEGIILEVKLPIQRNKLRLEFPEEGSKIYLTRDGCERSTRRGAEAASPLDERTLLVDEVFRAPYGRTGVVVVSIIA